MSSVYIRRLKDIGDEFIATRGALAYVGRNWQKHSLYNDTDLQAVGPQDVLNAAANIERTFIIRLFAAFEGMLKDHLAQQHPDIAVSDDASVAFLIDRVATLQTPHISNPLRQSVHEVRRYRNALVHSSPVTVTPLTFTQARSRLNTYLDKLPEPLS